MTTKYWRGAGTATNRSGTWTTTGTSVWSLSEGGPAGGGVPTSNDYVIFPNYGINYTVSVTSGVCGGMQMDGITMTVSGTGSIQCSGPVSLGGIVTWTNTGTLTLLNNATVNGIWGETYINSGGNNMRNTSVSALGYSVRLDSNITLLGTFTLNSGQLNLNGTNLTCYVFSSSNTAVRNIAAGYGVITLNSPTAGTIVLSVANSTNMSWSDGTGGIYAVMNTTRTFQWGSSAGGSTATWAPGLILDSGASAPTITGWFSSINFTGATGSPATSIISGIGVLVLGTAASYVNVLPTFRIDFSSVLCNGKTLGATTFDMGVGTANRCYLDDAFRAASVLFYSGEVFGSYNSFTVLGNFTVGTTGKPGAYFNAGGTVTCTTMTITANASYGSATPLICSTSLVISGTNAYFGYLEGGITTPVITLSGTTSTLDVGYGFDAGTNCVFTHSQGTLLLNGYENIVLAIGRYTSGGSTSTRSINWGYNSRITLNWTVSAATVVDISSHTGLTYTYADTSSGFQTDMGITRTFNSGGTTAALLGAINVWLTGTGGSTPTFTGYFRLISLGDTTSTVTSVGTAGPWALYLGNGTYTGLSLNFSSNWSVTVGLTDGYLYNPYDKAVSATTVSIGAGNTMYIMYVGESPGTWRSNGAMSVNTGTLDINNGTLYCASTLTVSGTGNIAGTSTIDVIGLATSSKSSGGTWELYATLNARGGLSVTAGILYVYGNLGVDTSSISLNGGTLSFNGQAVQCEVNCLVTMIGTSTINLNDTALTVGSFVSASSGVRTINFGDYGAFYLTRQLDGGTSFTNILNVTTANLTVTGSKNFYIVSTASINTEIVWANYPSTTVPFTPTQIAQQVNLYLFPTAASGTKTISGFYNLITMINESIPARSVYPVVSGASGLACTSIRLGDAADYTNLLITMCGNGTIETATKTLGQLTLFHTDDTTTTLTESITIGPSATTTKFVKIIKGRLDMNGYSITTGYFQIMGAALGTKYINFHNSFVILTGTSSAVNLDAADISNTTCVSYDNGGFRSSMDQARTFTCGSSGAPAANTAPNLSFENGAGATPTITSGSYFKRLTLTDTSFSLGLRTLNVDRLDMGLVNQTGLTVVMRGDPAIGDSGYLYGADATIAALTFDGSTVLGGSIIVTGATSLTNGVLNLNGQSLTTSTFSVTGSNPTGITNNTGSINVTGASFTVSNQYFGYTTAGTAYTINMSSASAKTFNVTTSPIASSSFIFGKLNISGSSGALTISGTNQFADITQTELPAVFNFTAGTTTTVQAFTLTGISGSLATIQSTVAGTAFTLSKASGTVSVDYLVIQDSTATGGAAWYAGVNSSNVSNNTGWIFTGPGPAPGGGVNGQFFVFF